MTVAQKVNNFFGGIFGIGTTTVRASAQAEYLGPLKMGSPSNQFGNDPDATPRRHCRPTRTSGPTSPAGTRSKQKGDAYAAGYCDIPTDGCSRHRRRTRTSTTTASGYYYAVDFKSTATVNLQAFDPSFVNVGDTLHRRRQPCRGGALRHPATVAGLPASGSGATPAGSGNAVRVRAPATAPATTLFTDHGQNGPPPNTTYTVLKATVPGDPNSATPVPGCPPDHLHRIHRRHRRGPERQSPRRQQRRDARAGTSASGRPCAP